MKEDILEQLVDDYLMAQGFFTMHNVKFQPHEDDPDYVAKDDCVASDVDVIGFHPRREGPEHVWVVSCKSWQAGFNPAEKIAAIEGGKVVSGREAWRGFRELTKRKWADALISRVEDLTGARVFTYVTAVTRLKGDANVWETHQPFKQLLCGNPIRVLTLDQMLTHLFHTTSQSIASSEVGRLLQIIKASGWKIPK